MPAWLLNEQISLKFRKESLVHEPKTSKTLLLLRLLANISKVDFCFQRSAFSSQSVISQKLHHFKLSADR